MSSGCCSRGTRASTGASASPTLGSGGSTVIAVRTEFAMKQFSCAQLVQSRELLGGGLLLAELHRRPQRHARHRELACFVLLHDADRRVLVALDHEAPARGDREERQHVAARHGRHERLLRIHQRRVAEERRRRRRGDLDPAVERPGVIARVRLVADVAAAAAPGDIRLVLGHGMAPRNGSRVDDLRRDPGAATSGRRGDSTSRSPRRRCPAAWAPRTARRRGG